MGESVLLRSFPRDGCHVQILRFSESRVLVFCTYLLDRGRSPDSGETRLLISQAGDSPVPPGPLKVIM